jgi:hypothetical protein
VIDDSAPDFFSNDKLVFLGILICSITHNQGFCKIYCNFSYFLIWWSISVFRKVIGNGFQVIWLACYWIVWKERYRMHLFDWLKNKKLDRTTLVVLWLFLILFWRLDKMGPRNLTTTEIFVSYTWQDFLLYIHVI